MMYDAELSNLVESVKLFEKTYEIVRVVDPVFKKILNIKKDDIAEMDVSCYAFWSRKAICQNCVSMRAYNENETFVKIEYGEEKIYFVTAIPYELGSRRIVVEMIKDATNSMILSANSNHSNTKSEIYTLINNMNNIAIRDALTEIYNRRYIDERLPVDMISATLSEQSIAVIMADIDFFKKINDTYGHQAGDDVLRGFAATLSKMLKRESDWVARYGGEEFLICLPGAPESRALEIAESMRKEVENHEFPAGDIAIKLTASFGVCCMKPTHVSAADEIIANADKKLYEAKRNGRNRVEA